MKTTSVYAYRGLEMYPKEVWNLKEIAKGVEVGIEIECEGQRLLGRVDKWWGTHLDGSLRNNGVEYVLAKPIKRGDVQEALQFLALELAKNNSKVNETYRTSVHVHLNAMDMKFRHIFNQICLYILFEELLVEMCGKERVGNLFCLRAKDAEMLVDSIKEAVKRGQYNGFRNNELFKYGAVNIAALGNYGSLEFRAFRGTVDPNLINDWVELLLDIKDAAVKYNDPQQICADFSILGARAFIEKVFTPKNQQVLLGFEDLEKRLYEGVRMVQEIAYAIPNWTPVAEEGPAAPVQVYGGDVVPEPPVRVRARAPARVARVPQLRPAPLPDWAIVDDPARPAVVDNNRFILNMEWNNNAMEAGQAVPAVLDDPDFDDQPDEDFNFDEEDPDA